VKFLTWQHPEQLILAQDVINNVKLKSCGIKDELKLPGMEGCWTSLEETHQLDKISLRDGMQLMIQHERDMRTSNRIARLIKNAGFRLKATLEVLDIPRVVYPVQT